LPLFLELFAFVSVVVVVVVSAAVVEVEDLGSLIFLGGVLKSYNFKSISFQITKSQT